MKYIVFISIDEIIKWSKWHSVNTDNVYYSDFFNTKEDVNDFIKQLKMDYPNSNLNKDSRYEYYIQYTILCIDENDKENFYTLCEMMRAYKKYKERFT